MRKTNSKQTRLIATAQRAVVALLITLGLNLTPAVTYAVGGTLADEASCAALFGGTWDATASSCTVAGLQILGGETLQINAGVTLIIAGDLTNNFTGTINNDGTVSNISTLFNFYGIINNNATGSLNNQVGSTINNDGTINNAGVITNDGSIINNTTGSIINNNTINNNSIIENAGSIVNNLPGTITNNATGSITNDSNLSSSGHVNNAGILTNNNTGTITNVGTITNNATGTLTNNGAINNQSTGTLNNDGRLDNNSTIVNDGSINNNFTGVINNNGTISGGGALTNGGNVNTPVPPTPTDTPPPADTPTDTPPPADTPTNTPPPAATPTGTPVPPPTPASGKVTGQLKQVLFIVTGLTKKPDRLYPAYSTKGVAVKLLLLKNKGSALRNVSFRVTNLSNKNYLLNADGGPGQVGSTLSVPNRALPGGNQRWDKNEVLAQSFRIGLQSRASFSFKVDVYATVAKVSAAGANQVDSIETEELIDSYTIDVDPEMMNANTHTLYLPLMNK